VNGVFTQLKSKTVH